MICIGSMEVAEAMHYGFVIPGGDVPEIVGIAQAIEEAGWDGVFVAEGVYGTDAWVTLGAMAARTGRVRLGTLLTPPSRRRPWKLASEVATLDRLSGGRAVLSVGLGALDTGFPQVGEATNRKVRAQLMDESLDIMELLWAGQPFKYDGEHYHIDWDNSWSYAPLQKPRVPVWVVGALPHSRSLMRAMRWDGVLVARMAAGGSFASITPDDVREVAEFVARHRKEATRFDIIVEGVSPTGDKEEAAKRVRPFAEAGATWWIESMWDAPGGIDSVLARIKQGPPGP